MEQDKKQQLVETALSLFYRHGVHAVCINQILEQSAIAKKHCITILSAKTSCYWLRRSFGISASISGLQWLEQQLASTNLTSQAEKLFDALTLWFEGKADGLGPFFGCYFQNCAAEYHDPDSAVL